MERVFHRRSATLVGRLSMLLLVGGYAALLSWSRPRGWWGWVLLGLALSVFIGMAVRWTRWRDERWVLTSTELRRESRRRVEVLPLEEISEVSYELSGARIPHPPRGLWLKVGRKMFYVGHRWTWLAGEWDDLVVGLAPWMVRAPRIDQPARRLLSSITGCVESLIPDGRPITEQIPVNRHPNCPNPELCDPHHPLPTQ